ncbi:uncharacterized protein JCM10292_003473 [Rhodotorula paludigena]|uniref:uncharacterized protein n=1 Tax=Rhodotorula paludigena TaxID=86838 RepID=UPI0031768FF6
MPPAPGPSAPPNPPPRPPALPWTHNLVHPANPYPSPLSGTQDLITRFHLAPLYDTFLRPYLPAALHPTDPAPTLALPSAAAAAPAVPPSPSPAPPPAAAAGGAGLKITLGGIKFGGPSSGNSAGTSDAGPAAGGGAAGKKRKAPRMDKTYEHMVGDVLGRISHPRSSSSSTSTSTSTSLLHLISNPDPAPCPPLHALDATQLREAFTLKPGGLAGFDMGVWEARGALGTGGGGGRHGGGKKKKKRKHDDGAGGGAGGEAKKHKR